MAAVCRSGKTAMPRPTAQPHRVPGPGLGNLEKRLAAIGGRCEIHSEPGQGTRVSMTVFLKTIAIATIGDWRGGIGELDWYRQISLNSSFQRRKRESHDEDERF